MRTFATIALVLTATILANAQSPGRQIIAGGNPTLPFSSAVKAGGFVYVAGSIGDGSTPLAKGDVRTQTKQTRFSTRCAGCTANFSVVRAPCRCRLRQTVVRPVNCAFAMTT